MLSADIPSPKRKQNSHDMATEYNADPDWTKLHLEQSKVTLPWHSPLFWGGVMSSVWFAGMVIWIIWGAAASAVKSEWIEKPAKAREVQELHDSMTRTESRVEKLERQVENNAQTVDKKLDHITDLIIQGAASARKEAPK